MATSEQVYKNIRVRVVTGDITKLEAQAIVNPANSQLIMGGGAAGAILRAGGDQIQKEALRKAPISIGEAVATTAGRLKAKHVIHAPTMTRPAMATNRENAKLATRAALQCATRIGIETIAFPGLGTGVGGLDPEDSAAAMVEEIKRHIDRGTIIREIILVGFDVELAQAFKNAIRNILA